MDEPDKATERTSGRPAFGSGQRPIPRILVVLSLLVMIALTVAGMRAWLDSRPNWVLTAKNTSAGLVLEVHESAAPTPTYVVVLQGQRVPREFSRVGRQELDPAAANTVFFDETLKPGRWTLRLDRTKIDIMEARLVINDRTELKPGQTMEIAP